MYEFYPYYTNDGSVGLYSPNVDDIYHSTYGALTEAYEKFILPADFKNYFKNNNKIKILDICFGIGYNTKSFINNFIENIYNETLYTNNTKYNDTLDTNNNFYNIFIHAIDIDKNLACLSPFFKTNEKLNKNNELLFKQEKIERMLSKPTKSKYKLKKETNIILLNLLKEYINEGIINITKQKKYSKYFDKYMLDLWSFYNFRGYKYTLLRSLNAFLHNIYYKYISKSHKNALNYLKNIDFTFKLSIDDARSIVKNDNNTYNYIFLDAFTPTKCPILWTVDFFKLLYDHLDENGMIITYSNSAQIRNAFLNAGFFIGKIYSNKKSSGTIAVKNKTLIKNELSEYDLGLIKTKAGIFYHDENLNALNEEIIERHKSEVKNSNLIGASKFKKQQLL